MQKKILLRTSLICIGLAAVLCGSKATAGLDDELNAAKSTILAHRTGQTHSSAGLEDVRKEWLSINNGEAKSGATTAELSNWCFDSEVCSVCSKAYDSAMKSIYKYSTTYDEMQEQRMAFAQDMYKRLK